MCDIDEESAQSVVAAIREAGGLAHAYGGDLGKRQVFLDTAEAFALVAGPIYALVNNASVLVYEPVEKVTEETIEKMLSAASSRCSGAPRPFSRTARARAGASSTIRRRLAYRGRPNTAVYAAIKGAGGDADMVMAGELGPPRHTGQRDRAGIGADARHRGFRQRGGI